MEIPSSMSFEAKAYSLIICSETKLCFLLVHASKRKGKGKR